MESEVCAHGANTMRCFRILSHQNIGGVREETRRTEEETKGGFDTRCENIKELRMASSGMLRRVH
jgi:hypothetical protein